MTGSAAPESELVISARKVSKKHAHQLGRASWYGLCDIAREAALADGSGSLRTGEFWALDNLDLDVRRGESIGVLGANGAGKTTLLKLLCGLLKPDRGEIRIGGSVEAIIELGAGINPLLSGRENVWMAAALHGLTRRERAEYFEKVWDFSELGGFIDDPVQSYSSGMRARLAYSIASHLKPDVLLVDEVLAVGDHRFQRKCIQHMLKFLHQGGALVLVSHNIHQMQAVCGRGLLLEQGRVLYEGTAVGAIGRYFERRLGDNAPAGRAPEFGPVVITAIAVHPLFGGEAGSRKSFRITIRFRSREPLHVNCYFAITTEDESIVITGDSDLTGRRIGAGEGEIDGVILDLPLLPGRYVARAVLADHETHQPLAMYGYEDGGQPFEVRGSADLMTNAQIREGHLIKVDVEWGRRPNAPTSSDPAAKWSAKP